MTSRQFLAAAVVAAGVFAAGTASAGTNLLVNGDFNAGNVGFSADYTLTTMTPQLFQNGVHGIYAIERPSDIPGSAAYGDWTNAKTDPLGGNSPVYVADGDDTSLDITWEETVTVQPHTLYKFSYYGIEVSNDCCSNAELQPWIGSSAGPTLTVNGGWQQSSMLWASNSNTSVTLLIFNNNFSGPFNDFAMDDLSFKALSVPEPSTWAVMLLGVGLAGAALRRRRSAITA